MSMRSKVLISGLLAALLWGGWAFYANIDFGWFKALRTSVAQGSFSFAATLLMTKLIQQLQSLHPNLRFKLYLAPTGAVLCSLVCLLSIHLLNKTPAILLTIAPSVSCAIPYSFWAARGFVRAENAPAADALAAA